jgi:hypothetical protein
VLNCSRAALRVVAFGWLRQNENPPCVCDVRRADLVSQIVAHRTTIADLAFRFAPAFSPAEQASVRVSVSVRVFAQAQRYFAFPVVAFLAFAPVDWRVSLPGEPLASTLVWPQPAVLLLAGELRVVARSAGDSLADVPPVGVLLVAAWLPAAVAPQAADSYSVPEWPPGDSVGAPLARARFPAALRLYPHPPADFPLADSLPCDSVLGDSLPDDSRCHALAPLHAQE